MKKNRSVTVYISDMIEASAKGISFVDGMQFGDFIHDEKTQFAVIRCIEIIGEAGKKVPSSIKKRYPDIPWRAISGMRDKLIHDYFGVNQNVVWITVMEDIPQLKSKLEIILTDLGTQELFGQNETG
ncbi:DUF86 domain-containing protein [Ignavibacteriales bacterium]